MRAFLVPRDKRVCSCGRTLWAVMGEADGECILATLCPDCDLTYSLNGRTMGIGTGTNPEPNDSGAPAQKA